MRYWYLAFLPLLLMVSGRVKAAPPRVQLDVTRFRNEDPTVKGGVVELYVTISGQSLTYLRRAPRVFQAAASLTLEVVRPDGAATYQETVTLKPPVLSDTTAAIKSPLSFQKRVALPEGTYTVRALVRDQYRISQPQLLERPLTIGAAAAKPTLSDVVLLSRAPARGAEAGSFSRGGYSLTRAPGGSYARGTDRLWLYAELYGLVPEQVVQMRYRLRAANAKTDALAATGTATGLAGRAAPVLGELDLSKVPSGNYTLTVEARAAGKLLATQTATVQRFTEDYAPAGAAPSR